MKVFDLHSDLFTDIAYRRKNGETNVFDRIHYPKLKSGYVDSVICVFWVEPAFRNNPLARFEELYRYVMEDLHESMHVNVCVSTEDMVDSNEMKKINVFLGLEGLTFMERWGKSDFHENIESAFPELHAKDFRHAIYAWNETNFLASGTGSYNEGIHKGLTEHGKEVTRLANAQNWIVDASHTDDKSFWDLYHTSDQPIIASHSNVRALCPQNRNLTDEQIKAIANGGGIIGLNAYFEFIDERNPTVDRFIDHAVYIAELVGPEYVAFGFDFVDFLDNHEVGASFEGSTVGLETVEQVPELLLKMEKRGFSKKELAGISFDNAFNFLSKQLKG